MLIKFKKCEKAFLLSEKKRVVEITQRLDIYS